MRFPQIAYMMRCISAETLKARRTIQLLGVIAMPTVLAVLNLVLMITASRENEYATPGGWLSFAHNTISFGSVLVLATAFSAHQEHDSGRWRTLMCLPVPKSSLYLGKLTVVSGLCLLSCLILFAENILLGGLLSILRPETGLSLARLDVLGLLLPFLLCFVYSLLLMAVHSWLSWRVQNLVVTLGAGFFLSLIGAFLHYLYAIKLWVIFAMPLIVSILAALLADVDHRARTWKQLFALPFPRPAIMASKWLALAGITLLSTLVFGAANLTGGILIHLLRSGQGLDPPILALEAFTKPLIAWLLSLFMVSIHMWISLRWTSFLVSATVGFAASVANLFLISSSLYKYSALSPWAMPIQTYDRWQAMLIPSLVGAVVVYWLAGRRFLRQDVY